MPATEATRPGAAISITLDSNQESMRTTHSVWRTTAYKVHLQVGA